MSGREPLTLNMKLHRINLYTGFFPFLTPHIALRHDRGLNTPRYYAEDTGLVLGVHTRAIGGVQAQTSDPLFLLTHGEIKRDSGRDTPWLIHPEPVNSTDFCLLMIESEGKPAIECPTKLAPLVQHFGNGPMCNRVTSIWSMNPTSSLRIVHDGCNYLVTNHRGALNVEELQKWEDSKFPATSISRSLKRHVGPGIKVAHGLLAT